MQVGLTVDGNVTIPSKTNGGDTSVLNYLAVGNTGKLDLNDNAMIVDTGTTTGSTLSDIRTMLVTGRGERDRRQQNRECDQPDERGAERDPRVCLSHGPNLLIDRNGDRERGPG